MSLVRRFRNEYDPIERERKRETDRQKETAIERERVIDGHPSASTVTIIIINDLIRTGGAESKRDTPTPF